MPKHSRMRPAAPNPDGMISWRVKDQLREARFPMVMGIINGTPDSFHVPSRVRVDDALRVTERMLEDGATMIDIGGMSTRPGAEEVNEAEEQHRASPMIAAVASRFPEANLSIDTWREKIAAERRA